MASRAPNQSESLDPPAAIEISPEEFARYFEDAVRDQMGMSAQEFIRRYDAGEYDDILDTPGHWDIGFLASLIPRGPQRG